MIYRWENWLKWVEQRSKKGRKNDFIVADYYFLQALSSMKVVLRKVLKFSRNFSVTGQGHGMSVMSKSMIQFQGTV